MPSHFFNTSTLSTPLTRRRPAQPDKPNHHGYSLTPLRQYLIRRGGESIQQTPKRLPRTITSTRYGQFLKNCQNGHCWRKCWRRSTEIFTSSPLIETIRTELS